MGTQYSFQADAYPFSAPAVPAIFFLVKMTAKTGGKIDITRLAMGQTDDLSQELSHHKKPFPDDFQQPNAILWLPVENVGARLLIWNDLGGPTSESRKN